MGYSIDDLLDVPYYSGSPISSLVPLNFPVAIAGHPFMIDVRKYSRRTLDAQGQQQDGSKEPAEVSLAREGFWRRGQSRFGLGSGQQFFDDDETSSGRRFYTSKGMDPWSDRGLTLLSNTEKKGGTNAPGTSTNLKCLQIGGWLYVADGSNLKLTNNPAVTNPTWTSIAAGGTISSICTDGVNVYIARTGSALQKSVIGAGTMAAFGALTPTNVWFANGRLIGSAANALYEIDAAGAMVGTGIRTDPRTSATWVSVTGSPHATFAALNIGGNCEVYSISINDTTTALGPPIWACALPNGETMNAMTFYAGVVVFATSIGVRIAQLVTTFSSTTSARTLEYGEAIGNAPDQVPLFSGGVQCLEPQGNFLWFGWTNFDADSTGLGRANLATNISQDTVVPGFCSDLMAGATGSSVQGTVTGVASFNNKRYFVVSGVGLYGETATYVPTGTWNSGWIRFGSLIDKQFGSVQLGSDPMVGSIAATLDFVDGSTHSMGTYSTAGETQSSLLDSTGRSVAAQLVLTFTRGSTTTAPILRYWSLNAYPAPPRVEEIILPIIISTRTTDLIGLTHTVDPLVEWDYLSTYRSSNAPIIVQIGMESLVGRVDNVAVLEGDVNAWQDPRGRGGQVFEHFYFNEMKVSVRILTKEH